MTQPQPSPQQALMTVRIIWGAMIMGVIMFMAVILFVIKAPVTSTAETSSLPQLLLYIAIGMLCVLPLVGMMFRRVIWRRGRDENGLVIPGAYSTGVIIYLALCEATAFFSLVGAMLSPNRGPHLFLGALAIAAMVIGFPTGAPMRSADGVVPIHRYGEER